MTIAIEYNVFWLKISVDDSILMKTVERKENFCGIEFSSILGETLLSSKMVEKLSAIEEIDDEVELLRRLESIVQFHNERVTYFFQNKSLGLCIFKLVSFDNHVFFQCLYGEVFFGVLLLN